LPRILSESLHRADIGNCAVADARDTKLGQAPRRWHAFHDHHIDGERNTIADVADQRIVPQARNEEAGRSCSGIGFRAVKSVVNRVCRVALLTQKQICPRIDKEVDALRSRSFTNGRDPPGVLVDWIEPGALNDAVFEIDPDDTEFKEAGHIFGQRTIVVAVAPLRCAQ
jgi:hypothetical protein